MAGELLEFPSGIIGMVLNLEEDNVGAVILGDDTHIKEGDQVKRTGRVAAGAGRRGADRPRGRPAGRSRSTARARSTTEASARSRSRRPASSTRQPVKEPLQTGIKAIDSMIPDRPRPARADHRRPPDRQDRHRHRHDHQPEGPGRDLLLRGHRPEGVDGRRRWSRRCEQHGAMEYTTVVAAVAPPTRPRCSTSRPTPAAPWASTSWTTGKHAAVRLRRPLQAGRRLPPAVACCCAARRAARPTPATCSTSTRRLLERAVKLSDELGGGSLTRCRSSRPRPATCPPTSRPT